MNEEQEITYEDMRKYLIRSINNSARDIWDKEKKASEDLSNTAFEKELLVDWVEKFKPTDEEVGNYTKWIYHDMSKKKKNDELDSCIDDALTFVDDAYKSGKYEGREIRSLFGRIFSMIGKKEYARFDAAYSLRKRD